MGAPFPEFTGIYDTQIPAREISGTRIIKEIPRCVPSWPFLKNKFRGIFLMRSSWMGWPGIVNISRTYTGAHLWIPHLLGPMPEWWPINQEYPAWIYHDLSCRTAPGSISGYYHTFPRIRNFTEENDTLTGQTRHRPARNSTEQTGNKERKTHHARIFR